MKVSITLCAIFYLFFSLGLSVNAHYCGGKLQSISFENTIKECGKCGKKPMKGCCKDVQTSIDVNDSNSFQTYTFVSNHSVAFVVPIFYSLESAICILHNRDGVVKTDAPPNDSSKPIYLKNNTFNI